MEKHSSSWFQILSVLMLVNAGADLLAGILAVLGQMGRETIFGYILIGILSTLTGVSELCGGIFGLRVGKHPESIEGCRISGLAYLVLTALSLILTALLGESLGAAMVIGELLLPLLFLLCSQWMRKNL